MKIVRLYFIFFFLSNLIRGYEGLKIKTW